MALTLHWISGSPFAWRVMWALEYLELSYTSRQLMLSGREHKSAEYLSLNPRGKVPTLQDGDFTIFESVAMLEYLDEQYGQSQLFGTTARESTLNWQIISEVDNYLMPAVFGIVRPIFFGARDKDPTVIDGHYAMAQRELDLIEKRLSSSDSLVFEQLSAADIVVMTTVQFLLRGLSKQPCDPDGNVFSKIGRSYTRLLGWMERTQSIKGYQASYPPHWKLS